MWLQGILSQLQEVFSRRPGVFRRLQGALSRLKWKSLDSLINHFVTKEIIFDFSNFQTFKIGTEAEMN